MAPLSSSPLNWSDMTPADFDRDLPPEPLALVDPRVVERSVPAVPDACGTEALFGAQPAPKRSGGWVRRPARPMPPGSGDTLF
ncbi:hypothetical protein [Streptomyces sp. NPDC047315]|uniref:hypothetical protein n=1 Tax=Streptomyces sp. NPDC047315 TaxID=3155142 RepID=UPI0033DBD907